MIIKNKRLIGSIYYNGRAIKAIYKGKRPIWFSKKEEITQILSCFSNGYWNDEYPWTDDTPWTD